MRQDKPNVKPKLLLDENISIGFHYKPKNAIESICVVGTGASDDKVISHATEKGLILVTGDRGIASRQINQKKSVYFVDIEKCYLYEIRIKRIRKLKTKLDPVTHYLRCGDKLRIVTP